MKRRRPPVDDRIHLLILTEKDGPDNVMYRGVGQDKQFTEIVRMIRSEYWPLLKDGRARLRIEVVIPS
jgi:hypothetical protein